MVWTFLGKENRYLPIDCKQFKTNQNEPKWTNATHNQATAICDQLPLNHVYNQVGFGKPVIKGRGYIYLGISKMVFFL